MVHGMTKELDVSIFSVFNKESFHLLLQGRKNKA